jgi:hypothetical protein
MGLKNTVQPRFPSAPDEYDRQYMEQLINVLRLYFNQLDNASPSVFASQGIGTTGVVSGLTFAQPDPTAPTTPKASLPTQADLAYLRAGDIYYDTTAGNVLKIKV